jgi:hypothetical protein
MPAGTPLIGWDAALSSITLPASQPLILFAEPKFLIFLVYPFINLLMLLSPTIPLFLPRPAAGLLPLVLIPAALIPLTLPKTMTGDLFIGFYLWISSFLLISTGCLIFTLTPNRNPHIT